MNDIIPEIIINILAKNPTTLEINLSKNTLNTSPIEAARSFAEICLYGINKVLINMLIEKKSINSAVFSIEDLYRIFKPSPYHQDNSPTEIMSLL